MAETAALIKSGRAAELEPESDSALFHRRIEFHQARKPFSGFGNNSSNGFKLVTLNPTSEPHVASGLGNKSEKSSEFCETGLDPELSFEVSFRRIGAGLRNLGNTCFLNSVLQCLTYTEPLAAYLQSGKHQSSCHTAGFCALCAIQKHVSRALQSTGRTLEPKDLVYNLRRISRNFRNSRQEDAHEYMVYLLESMHKCCLPSGVPSESPSGYDKSLVHKIFGGRLRSQVKCMQCSYCSNKFDPFLDLSLEIVKANSVEMALAHFTTKELLDGGAKEYQCQQCKQKVKALKQLTIYKAPHVLTVHLKRFGSHAPGQKIVKKIDFKPTLDLKPFVTGPYDGDLTYTLYGVLVHAGWSTRSGHYYCFVRTSSGMWYALDDNEVFQVNERKVLAQEAYMLFYVRDRKNFCGKKPFDTIQKGNFVMNGMGNATNSKINLESRGKIQNGSNENKLNGTRSVALSEKGAVVTTLLEETPSENISFPDTNGTMAVEKHIFPENFCAKKPDDTIQKENMVMNGLGNALSLESKEKIQNGSNEKKLNGSFSLARSERGAVVATLPEETPSVNIFFPYTNGTMAVDNLGLKRDHKSENSLVVPSTEDPLKEHSVMEINSVGHKGESCSSVDGSGDSFNLGHAAKNISCNNSFGVVEEQNTSAVILDNGDALQDSLHRKDLSDCIPRPSGCKDNGKENSSESAKKPPNNSVLGTSSEDTCKIDGANSEMCASKIMPMGAIAEPSNKANHVISSQQNSIEESQVGGSSVKSAVPTIEETRENGQRTDIVQSELLLGLPATAEPLPHEISKKKRPNLKVRRKLFKCQVGTTSLSSNIILGVGLCVRKKKHKRRKHNSVQKKPPNMKHMSDGNDTPSKLGQSVTEESFPVLIDHCTHSQKKKAQCGPDGQNQNLSIQNTSGEASISSDVIYNEFRERVVLNCNSAEKQPQTRHFAPQGTGNSVEYQRELRQTDVMSMLTRGLDETTVARWDGIDDSLSQKSETRAAEAAHIGYIGDKWDEEYDQGKRKKIRGSKISFGGPNLFQEIATKNSKRKRAKLERSRFENQPFRI